MNSHRCKANNIWPIVAKTFGTARQNVRSVVWIWWRQPCTRYKYQCTPSSLCVPRQLCEQLCNNRQPQIHTPSPMLAKRTQRKRIMNFAQIREAWYNVLIWLDYSSTANKYMLMYNTYNKISPEMPFSRDLILPPRPTPSLPMRRRDAHSIPVADGATRRVRTVERRKNRKTKCQGSPNKGHRFLFWAFYSSFGRLCVSISNLALHAV